MSEQQQNPQAKQQGGLSHLTREQVLLAGGTLLTSGLVDMANHFNPAIIAGGLFVTYCVGKLTPEFANMLIPASDPQVVKEKTVQVVNTVVPAADNTSLPQDALSKMKRLVGMKTPVLASPKDEREDAPRARDEEDDAQIGQNAQPTIIIPRAPAFRDMCDLITKKRLVLCYTIDGPIYGTIEDLLSMAIIGKPGRGKTTALIYYVAMLLKADAEVHVWDPHGSMSELDGAFPHLHYTDDLEDIPSSIDVLRVELEERRLLYKRIKDRIKEVKPPLLLLVDELPVIGEYNKSLVKKGTEEDQTPIKLISDFVLQARKWNCYFIGAGQSTDAEILPTRVTENLSSRIAFYCSNRRATMAGIDLEVAKKFLPALKPDDVKGKMIFDCSRLSESILGAIPAITIKDVQDFLGSQPQQKLVPTVKRQDIQNGTLTLNDAIRLVHEHPEIDPLVFMNRIADYQETDDLPEQETVEVVRSPYYPQSGSLRIDQVPTQVQPAASKQSQQPVQHLSPAKTTLEQRAAAKVGEALQYWNAGHNSVRKLQAASGWSDGFTRAVIRLMENQGLIERQR